MATLEMKITTKDHGDEALRMDNEGGSSMARVEASYTRRLNGSDRVTVPFEGDKIISPDTLRVMRSQIEMARRGLAGTVVELRIRQDLVRGPGPQEQNFDWEGGAQKPGLGKIVLYGAIATDNRAASRRAVLTQGTQQVEFGTGQISPKR